MRKAYASIRPDKLGRGKSGTFSVKPLKRGQHRLWGESKLQNYTSHTWQNQKKFSTLKVILLGMSHKLQVSSISSACFSYVAFHLFVLIICRWEFHVHKSWFLRTVHFERIYDACDLWENVLFMLRGAWQSEFCKHRHKLAPLEKRCFGLDHESGWLIDTTTPSSLHKHRQATAGNTPCLYSRFWWSFPVGTTNGACLSYTMLHLGSSVVVFFFFFYKRYVNTHCLLQSSNSRTIDAHTHEDFLLMIFCNTKMFVGQWQGNISRLNFGDNS